jgi:nucleoid-associated protein YgaU
MLLHEWNACGDSAAGLSISFIKEHLVGIFSRKKDDKKPADFSNVQSGSSSTAPQAPAAQPGASPGTTGQIQTYVVAKGDSLSKIARQYYGDANQWRRIYDANRDQISNPDLIHPGQSLKIPGA